MVYLHVLIAVHDGVVVLYSGSSNAAVGSIEYTTLKSDVELSNKIEHEMELVAKRYAPPGQKPVSFTRDNDLPANEPRRGNPS